MGFLNDFKLKLLWSEKRDFLTFRIRERIRDFTGELFENEFEIFRYLNSSDGVFVDVGANRGQSALACWRMNPRFEVVSFEPNEDMRPFLESVKSGHQANYKYHLCGLGEVDHEMILRIPMSKDHRFHEEASVVEGWLDSDCVRQAFERHQLSGEIEVQERKIRVRPLDSFKLRPRVIKVDVQGHEESVLKGGLSTIQTHKPILIVEENGINRANIGNMMSEMGYVAKGWNPKNQALQAHAEGQLNCVYVYKDDAVLGL